MKSGITARSIVVCFFVVLALYLATFYGIEYSNRRRGPWSIRFVSGGQANPSIIIEQPKLGIASFKIVFAGEKVPASDQTVHIAQPVTSLPAPMPFGEVVYQDLRALPGVVTFNFFGHEVELLPRVLVVNKREIPWKPEAVIELWPTNKLPDPPRPPKGWETNALPKS